MMNGRGVSPWIHTSKPRTGGRGFFIPEAFIGTKPSFPERSVNRLGIPNGIGDYEHALAFAGKA
jgi:hypothetical protein